MKNMYDATEITSIMINISTLLLRKKSTLWPYGRTTYRFKKQLRKKVTIIGKTAFNVNKPNELNQNETADDDSDGND